MQGFAKLWEKYGQELTFDFNLHQNFEMKWRQWLITAFAAEKNNNNCCESQSPPPLRNSFCFANLCALLSNLGWFLGERFFVCEYLLVAVLTTAVFLTIDFHGWSLAPSPLPSSLFTSSPEVTLIVVKLAPLPPTPGFLLFSRLPPPWSGIVMLVSEALDLALPLLRAFMACLAFSTSPLRHQVARNPKVKLGHRFSLKFEQTLSDGDLGRW